MNRYGPHPRLFHTWFRLVPNLFLAIFKRFCDYILRSVCCDPVPSHTTRWMLHMQLLYVQRVIVCSVNDIQNDGTASVNPAFTEAWDRGACKPPSVAIRSLHNVINRYLAVTRPMEVDSLSGGNIDIITFLARHSEREIFPQDVERRFGITRSTSSRVLALMERKGLIVRESVPRDARLKKIVLTDKSRDIAEALRTSAIAMEGILLQGLSDDEIREFMHVLDVMQTNLVSTGLIGDESRYSSLALCEAESRERQSRECESQPTVRKTSQEDETGKEE